MIGWIVAAFVPLFVEVGNMAAGIAAYLGFPTR
jgi:hypothetical protein